MTQTEPCGPHMPASQATQLIADEMRALQKRLEQLEVGMEAIVVRNPSELSAATVKALQEMDMIVQSTGALADYVVAISELLPPQAEIGLQPALDTVPLNDMVTRLSGQTHQSLAAGVPELF
ncbi:MAG: chemotaxis protein [Paracoccaceae bacterium]|nr:chemotaxis protein [Paracoccaceae bacterium]